jgi:hypothetical protein
VPKPSKPNSTRSKPKGAPASENTAEQNPDSGGRPPWEPTDKQRGEVTAFTVAGYTQEQIGAYLDVDPKTLRQHCRQELDFARMKVIANCATNVVRLANGVPAEFDAKGNKIRDEIPMSLGPNAFILKTQGKKVGEGWSERVEVTGKDGTPLMHDLSKLTDAELEIVAAAQRLLAGIAPAAAGPAGTGQTTH